MFIKGIKNELRFDVFLYRYLAVLAQFVKNVTLSTLNYLPCEFAKIQLNIYVALYLHFLFCSTDLCLSLTLIPYCFDYCNLETK